VGLNRSSGGACPQLKFPFPPWTFMGLTFFFAAKFFPNTPVLERSFLGLPKPLPQD